jgi:hypothetical protein
VLNTFIKEAVLKKKAGFSVLDLFYRVECVDYCKYLAKYIFAGLPLNHISSV